MSKGGKRKKVKRREKNKTMEELQTRTWKKRNFERYKKENEIQIELHSFEI